jgi:ABC-type sugar transport system permease subunit
MTTLTRAKKQLFNNSLSARSNRAGYLFVLPAVGMLVLFLVAPVILAFSLGFTNAKFASPNEPAVYWHRQLHQDALARPSNVCQLTPMT